MIALTKGEEPIILVQNGATWLSALKESLNENIAPSTYAASRYRHPEIKQALIQETHGKCAYCESFLLHVDFGDVEHITPKSLNVDDTFRWPNLTLACSVCNTYKGANVGIIDPYEDDPSAHFRFLGPMILPRPQSAKAISTEKRLRLNRGDLLGQRSKRLQAIANQMLLIKSTIDAEVRQALLDDLLVHETGPDTEFSAFVRSFILIMQAEGEIEGNAV